MVGLNHEFARKLLWREYPTDQRGSYFRQFWDARGFIDNEDAHSGAIEGEALRHPGAAPLARRIRSSAATTTGSARYDAEAGGAGDPRRAAEEVPDRGDLRAPCALGDNRRARSTSTKPRTLRSRAASRRSRRDQGAHAAVRGEGRSGHLLLRLRSHDRRGEGRNRAESERRSRLVLRDQGAAGRAAVRPGARRGRMLPRSSTS